MSESTLNETIIINGITYKMDRTGEKIHLQRYNAEFKMWVNLYFPTDKEFDDSEFIDILTNLYIERNLFAKNSKKSEKVLDAVI